MKFPIAINIERLGIFGEGIGTVKGKVLFVPYALPSEKVLVSIESEHVKHSVGKLLKILEQSENRTHPPCDYFGKCGGCQLMHLNEKSQLKAKQQKVADALERIAHIHSPPVFSCIPSPQPLSYRNKIQLPITTTNEGIEIGLYQENTHHLIPIQECRIHCDLGETVFKKVKQLLKNFPAAKQLRHLLIKTALNTKEVLVIFVTTGISTSLMSDLSKQIMDHCPEVKGVVENINSGKNNVILGSVFKCIKGQDYIYETLNGFKFKVSPASFFQVNPHQAEHLYRYAIAIAKLKPGHIVLDGYCGVGTFALQISPYVKKVIGIEAVNQAISDAKINAELNQITNCEFLCGKVEAAIHKISNPDIVFLNPPRKGCESSVLKCLLKIKPEKIVMISCDPATMARDLKILIGNGYLLDHVQPFDMFPQTYHVESVALLVRETIQ